MLHFCLGYPKNKNDIKKFYSDPLYCKYIEEIVDGKNPATARAAFKLALDQLGDIRWVHRCSLDGDDEPRELPNVYADWIGALHVRYQHLELRGNKEKYDLKKKVPFMDKLRDAQNIINTFIKNCRNRTQRPQIAQAIYVSLKTFVHFSCSL